MGASENIQSNEKYIFEQLKEKSLILRKFLYWALENATVSNEEKGLKNVCVIHLYMYVWDRIKRGTVHTNLLYFNHIHCHWASFTTEKTVR